MSNSVKKSEGSTIFDNIISLPGFLEMLRGTPLECSKEALYQRLHRRQIPGAKKVLGKWVFNRRKTESWLAQKGLANDVQT